MSNHSTVTTTADGPRPDVVAARLVRLGFPEVYWVKGRASIADLYGRENRCGIYVLEFATGEYYVGQAKDVTRRFVQHTKNHIDIERVRFQPVCEEALAEVERLIIADLEHARVPLRNIALTSVPHGESDLDLVLERAAQERWLAEPSYQDWSGERADDPDLRRKYALKLDRMLELPCSADLISVVREYVRRGVPAPRKTELSFWSASALPPNPRGKLYIRINLHLHEVLSAGLFEGAPFLSLHLSASPFRRLGGSWLARLCTGCRFGAHWTNHRYPCGGTDQQEVVVDGIENMRRLLSDDQAVAAIRLYNLRLMQKGPSLNYRSHCFALADRLVSDEY